MLKSFECLVVVYTFLKQIWKSQPAYVITQFHFKWETLLSEYNNLETCGFSFYWDGYL